MKLHNLFLFLIAALVWSCSSKDSPNSSADLSAENFPANFTVDIPSAISSEGAKSGRLLSVGGSDLSGGKLYAGLPGFIHLGEQASETVEKVASIARIALTKNVTNFTVISDDDKREKKFEFTKNVSYGGVTYAHEMKVIDKDGDLALQAVWNLAPVSGTIVANYYYLNRTLSEKLKTTMVQIDYSENDSKYTQKMVVTISGLADQGTGAIKMMVGKKGDIVDVVGNALIGNIPTVGTAANYSYAFTARGNTALNIGAAALALPPATVTSSTGIMETHSVYKFLSDVIKSLGVTNDAVIAAMLTNAQTPGYFDKTTGFLSAGVNLPTQTGFTADFVNMSTLAPYAPSDVAKQQVVFLK